MAGAWLHARFPIAHILLERLCAIGWLIVLATGVQKCCKPFASPVLLKFAVGQVLHATGSLIHPHAHSLQKFGEYDAPYALAHVWEDVFVVHPLVNLATYFLASSYDLPWKGLVHGIAQTFNALSGIVILCDPSGMDQFTKPIFVVSNGIGNGINAVMQVCIFLVALGSSPTWKTNIHTSVSALLLANALCPLLIVTGVAFVERFDAWFLTHAGPFIYTHHPLLLSLLVTMPAAAEARWSPP
uniref:Uncharacterized protein n=1 Tax=Haptolina brevifila TaxID=156173 RepID=A0A7S2HLT1_9EUKA|mmetsp:Transcript_55955/g.111055  ORF Transcript_55955/g.111055 Transcript_55955/m.111055 type:complete len:242 (+) Transcript_55955:89-814(+)|eukprot:CAMPEP_0174711734 /NCGR_PEP_ID=MMETSP1094-20130205/12969_1 /TAXON_ID=156173 /ORGANISM="Chrysochromulina brevifilum, Strain UTEX LB 985" /LENGTH=241 /DNA_ID=CAMNT_0015910713 /DNA_START=77 /DNA_END=802 /DNA_ORIENTATION=-